MIGGSRATPWRTEYCTQKHDLVLVTGQDAWVLAGVKVQQEGRAQRHLELMVWYGQDAREGLGQCG